MGKVKTQGTEVYAVASSLTPDVVLLGCVTSIDGLGGAASQIDVTCFNSEEMEYEGGLPNPGQITLQVVYDTSDASFEQLVDLKDSREVVGWYIGGNQSDDPPTADSNFLVVPPTTRSGIDFRGYVSDISFRMEINNIWRATVTIQRSGPYTLRRPS